MRKLLTITRDNLVILYNKFPELVNVGDTRLCFEYWHMFEEDKLMWVFDGETDVADTLTSTETIRRMRQKLNEDKLFLPTDPEVLKRRRIKQDKMTKVIHKV